MVLKNLYKKYISYSIENMQLPEFKKSSIVRKRIIFYGNVQNVGFRFETYKIATKLGLTGFVRNKEDLTVESEIQGDSNKIFFLIEYMKGLKRITITKVIVEDMDIINGEIDFKIKY